MNRRGFLASLFGAGAAAALPAAPVSPPAFHSVAFSFKMAPLSIDDVRARYIIPAIDAMAREIDQYRYSQRITVADSRRFDPARLPA